MSVGAIQSVSEWVQGSTVQAKRLDPLYYDPELTRAERYLMDGGKVEWSRLGRVTSDIYSFGAYELTNHIRFVEPSSDSVPFITVTEIGLLSVDLGATRHIDRESHNLLVKSRCRPGNLLLSMSGSIGRVAVVPGDRQEYNSNQDVAKVLVDEDKGDPYFLAAYFGSSVGQSACFREAAGAIQKHLYLYNIAELPVPCPGEALRRAIGNKVRAAECLRRQAASAREELMESIGNRFPPCGRPEESLGSSWDFLDKFSPGRLDAWYNHAIFRDLEAQLTARDGLVPLSSLAREVSKRWQRDERPIRYVEIGDFDLSAGTVTGTEAHGGDAPSRAKTLSREGDVAISLVRPNRQNVVYIQALDDLPVVVTSGCAVLRFKTCQIAALYSVLLRSNAVTYQLMRWNVGTSYPTIEGLPIDRILVPEFSATEMDALGQLADTAVNGPARASQLVSTAIGDVEELIEGDLDEHKCIEEGRKLADEFGLEKP